MFTPRFGQQNRLRHCLLVTDEADFRGVRTAASSA